jgi:hypothetical protein
MQRAERLARAEEFLQEAVYQSRARQAAGTFLAQTASELQRQCGLGLKAEVVLELSPRGAELFRELWSQPPPAAEVERVQHALRSWIERQDALDRERNHFLKAFRQRHGFDRNAYAPDLRTEFERGLEAVNAQVAAERRTAAERVLG